MSRTTSAPTRLLSFLRDHSLRYRSTPALLGLPLTPFLLVALIYMALLAVVGAWFTRELAFRIEQELIWSVPAEVAAALPPLGEMREQRQVVPKVLKTLSITNPELEAYILDAKGDVIYPPSGAAKFHAVSLEPLNVALLDRRPVLPLFGDDPAHPGERVLYSAARTLRGEPGFVYLVLRSRILEQLTSVEGVLRYIGTLFIRFLPFLPFAIISTLVVPFRMSRSLMKILKLIIAFGRGGVGEAPVREDHAFDGQSDDEMESLTKELDLAARHAIQQERILARREEHRLRFLLDIVHDVRGPLTGMRGAVETMLREIRRPGTGLGNSVKHVVRFGLDSIRGYASSLRQAGGVEFSRDLLERSEIDPGVVAGEVVLLLQARAREGGISLKIITDESLKPIWADQDSVRRIFLNLADNAIRHTRSGGEVRIRMQNAPDGVYVEVVDSGSGIPNEDLPFVFNPFFRGTDKRKAQGAGVGLAIVKQLLELHGATISVESKVGTGTKFFFTLPRKSEVTRGHESVKVSPAKPGTESAEFSLPSFDAFVMSGASVICSVAFLSLYFQTTSWFAAVKLLSLAAVLSALLVLLHPVFSDRHSLLRHRLEAFLPLGGFVLGLLVCALNRNALNTLGAFVFPLAGLWGVRILDRSFSAPVRWLSVFPFLFITLFWEDSVNHSILAWTLLIAGYVMGLFVSQAYQQRHFLRKSVLLTAAWAMPFVGWAGLTLHVTWQEEFARGSKEQPGVYAQRLADEIARLLDSDVARTMLEVQSLNLKHELAIRLNNKWMWSFLFSSQAQEKISELHDNAELAGPLATTESWSFFRRLIYPSRIPLAASRSSQAQEGPFELLVYFASTPFEKIFRRYVHSYDFLFVIFATLLGILVDVPLYLFLKRRLQTVLRELRGAVATFRDPSLALQFTGAQAAFGSSVVLALNDIAERTRSSASQVERSDAELRELALVAAAEYSHFVESAETATAELEAFEADSSSSAAAGAVIRRLESVVEPEIMLTQALFVLAQAKLKVYASEPAFVSVREVVDEIIEDLLGLCEIHEVEIANGISARTELVIDRPLFTLMIFSFVQGMLVSQKKGSRISLSEESRKDATVIVLRTVGDSDASTVDTTGKELRSSPRKTLGILIGVELSQCAGFSSVMSYSTNEDIVELRIPSDYSLQRAVGDKKSSSSEQG